MKQDAIFIIWDSSKNNFKDIISDISNVVEIKTKKKINVLNYYNFICDIYKYNNQNELGIHKAKQMCIENNNKKIYILHVSFYTSDLYNYDKICNLKKQIREKYKNKTKNYFHDNIIHATDNYEEYCYVMKLLKDEYKFY